MVVIANDGEGGPRVSEADQTRGVMSRRQLLRGGLGAAAAIGLGGSLTGCGSALSAGLVGSTLAPGTVTYWNLFGGGDGARMQSMQQQYQGEHGVDSLQAATFAIDASRLEVTLTGGAGYALGSPANRRCRETTFLPIQSPSEGQLRWELTRYE